MEDVTARRPSRCAPRMGFAAHAGLLVSGLAVVFGILGGAAQVSAQSESAAGNGGTANAGASGNVSFGDVSTGDNQGNVINAGDVVNSDAEFNGGEVSNPTILYVTVPIDPPEADASGGNEAVAGGPDEPDPIRLNVRGSNSKSDVNVRTRDTNNNTNTNTNNNNATDEDGAETPTP